MKAFLFLLAALGLAVVLGVPAQKPKPEPKPLRLLVVGSPGCVPCRKLKAELEAGKVDYVYVNFDALRDIAKTRYMPSLWLVGDDGKVVRSHVGRPAGGVKAWINSTNQTQE